MIIVSTDGSCLKNPGGPTGWAWVNHMGPSASGGSPDGTNQTAELQALLEAVLAHPGEEPLLIESDSQYAIKCASEWLPGWKRKGWRTAAGAPVKNVELIQRIDASIVARQGPVRFRWVRGHVGNHFNEVADTLAGEAARAIRDPESAAANPVEPAVFDSKMVEPEYSSAPAPSVETPVFVSSVVSGESEAQVLRLF